MPHDLLTTPTQILTCVEATFRRAHPITLCDRSDSSFTFQLDDADAPDRAIHVEVLPLGLLLRTNLPIPAGVEAERCLVAANAMTRGCQLLAASVDLEYRQFMFDLRLPLGTGCCTAEQVTELVDACLRILQIVPAPLTRYMRGRIDLDRLIVSLVLPGVGFDDCGGILPVDSQHDDLSRTRLSNRRLPRH